jgi:hypothetical protein
MNARILPAIFLILLCPSCARRPEGPSHKVETIDGVKVVRNFNTASPRAFKPVEFDIDLSIGVEEGRENDMFVYPVDVDSDPGGDIYVLDYQDCVVKKYDARGAFLKQFGRKGQGPGEFQGPGRLRIGDGNEIYVGDDRKVEVFTAEGEYRRTLAVDLVGSFDIVEGGNLIFSRRTSDKTEGEYESLGRWDVLSRKAEDFLSQKVYWPARIMDDEFAYEFPYFVRWGVSPKRQIYAASAVDYAVSVFDSRGKLLFRFTRDFAPVPVVGEEMKRIEAIRGRLPAKVVENPYQAKLVYPAFKYISVDEADRVWVEQYQPGWRKRVRKETIYDIFSADGIFLFSTKMTGQLFPQLKFKNGFVYALKKNDSGFVSAVRMKLKE